MKPQRRTSHIMRELNSVPLIDVLLVVLFFYMIISPMMSRGAGREPAPVRGEYDQARGPDGPDGHAGPGDLRGAGARGHRSSSKTSSTASGKPNRR